MRGSEPVLRSKGAARQFGALSVAPLGSLLGSQVDSAGNWGHPGHWAATRTCAGSRQRAQS